MDYPEVTYLVVCSEPATAPASAPRNLGPQFFNAAIARLWLSNYLISTADSLELDGDRHSLADAYRAAASAARKDGSAVVGTIHYQVTTQPA
jgi:hypothetical protein